MTTDVQSLQPLVSSLHDLDESAVTLETVAAMISATEVDDESLAPFLNFRPLRYTRNLVSRSALFDVIVLCWMPGQTTPIHNHSGQLGWVRVLQGALEEVTYTVRPAAARDEGADATCLFAPKVVIGETGRALFEAGSAVVTVDAVRAVHRMGNPATARGCNAVSLHVYSRPHDSCLTYGAETGAVRRVQLSSDNW